MKSSRHCRDQYLDSMWMWKPIETSRGWAVRQNWAMTADWSNRRRNYNEKNDCLLGIFFG